MPREASTHLSRKGGMSNLNRVLKERSKQRNRKTEAQKDKKQKNKNKKFKKEFQDKKPHSGPGRTRLERAEGPTRDIMYLSVWGRYVPYTCAAGHWTGASHTWGRHSSTKLYVELRVFFSFYFETGLTPLPRLALCDLPLAPWAAGIRGLCQQA